MASAAGVAGGARPPQRLADIFGGSGDWTLSAPAITAIVVVFPLWDSIATVRKARNARRLGAPAVC